MSTTFSCRLSVANGQRPIDIQRRRDIPHSPFPIPHSPHRAFTLVELLVVIGIIGILTSIASIAMFRGLTAAKQARTAAEVTQLAGAMEQFKLKFGDYPPSYLNHTDPTSFALMRRFLAKAFPRCNPDVEIWYIPWVDTTSTPPTSFYMYVDSSNAFKLWDPAGGTSSASATWMSPAEALVFWLTSISKDPAHPLSALTTDRYSFFDFDNARITRLNPTASVTNNITGSGWSVVTGVSSVPTWGPSQGPTTSTPGSYAKYNPGTYAPRDGSQQGYVYFEARCYLFYAMFPTGQYPPAATATNPPPLNNPPVPYLSQSAPWDTNLPPNGYLDAGDTTTGTVHDVQTDSSNNIIPQSFTTFQKLCVNPKSFQIISAGADNDFGLANVSASAGGAPPVTGVTYNSIPVNIVYKSYPDGQGYDNLTNGDDDNITNFSETTLGSARSR